MATKRRQRGRPTLPDALKKSQAHLLRMGAVEKRDFEEAAEIAGISLSAWIRERLRAAAARELQAVGRAVRFLATENE